MSLESALREGALVDVNAAVAADVEPAVAAKAGLRLCGWNIRESDGTPAVATFRIIHGITVSGGTVIATIELAANASKDVWYGAAGIAADSGISIDRIAIRSCSSLSAGQNSQPPS